jgi:CubicO group peptidase (beta-lactamase class C family)
VRARVWAMLLLSACATPRVALTSSTELDATVTRLMRQADVPGLAIAVLKNGQVTQQRAYGVADVETQRPLQVDSVMYAASLTKAAFAWLALQLAAEGVFDLDAPLPSLLARPLPSYPDYVDLAGDERWKKLTPRMLLSHTSGLLNWRFINDDGKLDFKYEPGLRYVYSGEGIQVLQLVVEERTGRGVGELMQERVFDRFGMKDTSMVWRADFEGRTAVGNSVTGAATGFKRAKRARAAGSMVTTVADYAKFVAGVLAAHAQGSPVTRTMFSPQLAIVSPQQFPSHFPGETQVNAPIKLSAALGWVTYQSPLGPAVFKEGNDDGTNNFVLVFPDRGEAVVLLSNSARADRLFFPLVEALYGTTCLPWFWMSYVPWDRSELRSPDARRSPIGGCGERR